MSEIKSEDPGATAPQPIHVIPQHRVIPQAAVAPQLVTVHNQFQDAPVEPPVVTATSFQARPKPTRFPIPFHDASSSLTTLTAAVTQLQSTMVHSFSTSSVTNAAPHIQRPPSGITQVLAAGLISQHQGHAPSPQPSNPMQTQQQQHQFQKLKVEDALSYLDQVKFQFGNQPQVYNDFLDIMKEFKSQSIDTPGVIARVSHLFNGHPDLIVGFNTFLPPGYKIEVSANDQVNVTGPNMVSQTIHPLSGLMEPSQQSSTTIQVNVHTPHGKFATTLPQLPTHRSSPAPPPGPPSGAQALQNAMFPTQRSSLASSTASGPNTNTASNPLLGAAPINQPQTTGVGGQPVEFNHAINYVNKIKNRFQGQPDIYKAFLEILHKYQKEQRNVKDSNGSYVPSLSESEVYSQVARLFQNDEDLLREFGQFLPDAGGAVSSGNTSSLAHASTFAASPASNPQKGDSVMNDHGSTVKKQHSQSSGKQHRGSTQQAVKRVAQPATHMPSGKRAKSSSLKDVSISEASKCGSLSEFAFFDKVRRALHSQEAYDNFLRCLLLYNNEVVGREELIRLVQPFFMKFTELFSWLKKFLGHKDVNYAEMESDIVIQQQTKEKHEGMAMEIDYRTLKRLGSSYRLLPHGFTQPRCTGRDALCHEVLNDTLVSFPSWSEDSQSVTSRKTPFEEHMYRCEDERYQLDVVIETNLGAIRSLEAVNKKLSRMSDEDKAKFRLDNYLGGTSEVTQRKAIHRIYGDKAPDMIEGLKKNPGVAVPLVLKRLKLKDDEWREAQLQFNKVWRSQCEKYYLKSLDHQGIGFKANDTRFIRSKSLLNEIETAYDERQESTENNASLHHMTLEYEDKGIMDDAASLIIHHAKRQSGINKDDKQKVRQVMHQVLPDLYFAPRGNQPSDDEDDDDDEDTEGEKQEKPVSGKQPHKPTGESPMDDNPDGRYHLFLGNNNFYLFFRLHFILCERLLLMSRRSEQLAEEEVKERRSRGGEAVAEMLQLRQINEIEPEEYYPSFLDMVRNLLDGNVDSGQYEDTLREMFTIHAYHAFTMDKLVQNIVRQLQHIVQDETCVHLLDLYHAEANNQATGGLLASQAVRSNAEAVYQRKAEHLSRGENCFKFTIGQKLNHLHVDIELLDTDKDGSLDLMEVATWSEYLDNYVTSDEADVTRQMKERLGEKPVFLQRNANHLRRCAKNSEDEDQSLVVRGSLESKIQTGSYKLTFVPGSGDFTYRLGCFSAARKAHPLVSEQLHGRVRTWLGKWEDENVSRDMARQTNHWLMGKSHGLVSQITTIQAQRQKAGKLSRNFYQVRLTEA